MALVLLVVLLHLLLREITHSLTSTNSWSILPMNRDTLALWYSEDPYEGVIDYEYILFQQEQNLLLREVEATEENIEDDTQY